jgi:AhpD family alkylhydroperoxidase
LTVSFARHKVYISFMKKINNDWGARNMTEEEFVKRLGELRKGIEELISKAPEISKFTQYVYSAEGKKILDTKTKELISLGIAVAMRCEDCIYWHTEAAIKAGASEGEILDVLKVAICLAGSPALIYAVKALRTMKGFL